MRRSRPAHVSLSHRRLAAAALFAVLAPPARAQARPAPPAAAADSGPVCLGFRFGTWTPALDWRAAGHGARIDGDAAGAAPGGRGWAANGAEPTDSSLMLFPAWWPVGVSVSLTRRPAAPGDTVAGGAVALVNDARIRAPRSRVRAWRVPCRR